jgi:hypothetical protein
MLLILSVMVGVVHRHGIGTLELTGGAPVAV